MSPPCNDERFPFDQQIRHSFKKLRRIFCIGSLLLPLFLTAQTTPRVWVVYPQTAPPERVVYDSIREGIRATAGQGGLQVEELSTSQIAALPQVRSPDLVITLGSQALGDVQEKVDRGRIIAGATQIARSTKDLNAVSTLIDPSLALQTLRELAPRVQRVHVVITQSSDRTWIQDAQQAAHDLNVELVVHSARTTSEAGTHYLNIFRYGNPQTDSLWLIQDRDSLSRELLARVVEESWANNFIVFSNVLEHVRAGTLFSLYPDPQQLGERLGAIAVHTQNNPKAEPRVEYLKEVSRAVNMRVAAHLQLNIDARLRRQFELRLGEG